MEKKYLKLAILKNQLYHLRFSKNITKNDKVEKLYSYCEQVIDLLDEYEIEYLSFKIESNDRFIMNCYNKKSNKKFKLLFDSNRKKGKIRVINHSIPLVKLDEELMNKINNIDFQGDIVSIISLVHINCSHILIYHGRRIRLHKELNKISYKLYKDYYLPYKDNFPILKNNFKNSDKLNGSREIYRYYYDLQKEIEIGDFHVYSPFQDLDIYIISQSPYEYIEPQITITDSDMSFKLDVSINSLKLLNESDENKAKYNELKSSVIPFLAYYYRFFILEWYLHNYDFIKYNKIYRKYGKKNKSVNYKKIACSTYETWQNFEPKRFTEKKLNEVKEIDENDYNNIINFEYPNFVEHYYDNEEKKGSWNVVGFSTIMFRDEFYLTPFKM